MSFFIVGLKFKIRFFVHVYSLQFNHADRFPPLTAAAFLHCVKNQRCTVETALLFSYMKLSEGLGVVFSGLAPFRSEWAVTSRGDVIAQT